MERTFEQRFSTAISARHPPGRKDNVKNLLHPASNTRIDPKTVLQDAIVRLSGYFYAVDLGPDVHPRSHHVGKNRRCSCALGSACPAVSIVATYLRNGGERTPDPPHGFYPEAPECCPICGAPAYFEPKLTNKRRGAGWGCSKTGEKHYWTDRTRIMKEARAANPWRFPPVVVRAGEQINAWDGIISGDRVLYPGLLRAEIGA